MNEVFTIIFLPIAAGLLLFLVPDKLRTVKGIIALLVSIISGYLAIWVYALNIEAGTIGELAKGSGLFNLFGKDLLDDAVRYAVLKADNLSRLIVIFIRFIFISYSSLFTCLHKRGKGKKLLPVFPYHGRLLLWGGFVR